MEQVSWRKFTWFKSLCYQVWWTCKPGVGTFPASLQFLPFHSEYWFVFSYGPVFLFYFRRYCSQQNRSRLGKIVLKGTWGCAKRYRNLPKLQSTRSHRRWSFLRSTWLRSIPRAGWWPVPFWAESNLERKRIWHQIWKDFYAAIHGEGPAWQQCCSRTVNADHVLSWWIEAR